MIFKKFLLENENDNAFLNVQVFDSDSEEPISDAEIAIYKITISGMYGETGEGIEIINQRTNQDGLVSNIKLPFCDRLDINHIEGYPVVHYHMVISYPGYYDAYVVNLERQIFPNITTMFKVDLKNKGNSVIPRFYFSKTPEIWQIHEMPH